ncbi:MetQ/NlpA family ABC transporter substrate-binding protein [Alkalicella caledoniensis]|uniref:Lipoprotein n=1 Tax=Alkalicella caledoniensis TaxID=2731377 RepID=A0A7G9WA19_ALKCA|nr:MetQ/NlpA family ABC transporter substrate-binding protein [Alkalicella caledoniensis]QNO15531.1 MetQ/NlpA family ABC transporter substrate-binding protein [Alkalicella caledoniensis]
MKKIIGIVLSLIILLGLTACGSNNDSENTLVIGVTGGPHEEIGKKIKEIAAKEDLEIKLVVFNEYVQPNIQLHEKQLDVNIFQHQPYLDQFNKDRNYNIVSIASTINFPMGVYSNKLESLDELVTGDKIGLPNDLTNQGRALILFESAGIIKLKEGTGIGATVRDIAENPKNLEFIELDAPIILRTLPDLAVAAINTNFIIEAGMNPVRDSIFIEPQDSPWVNVIATRPELKDDARVKRLIEIYHSEEIRDFIWEAFDGSIVPGF